LAANYRAGGGDGARKRPSSTARYAGNGTAVESAAG